MRGTSLVVQWLRLCLPVKGVQVLIPGQGAKIPHASRPKNQNIKQKQYCNKFNKDFKNGPQPKKKKTNKKKRAGINTQKQDTYMSEIKLSVSTETFWFNSSTEYVKVPIKGASGNSVLKISNTEEVESFIKVKHTFLKMDMVQGGEIFLSIPSSLINHFREW